MNDELVKDKIETYERRLDNPAGRLDKLEQDFVEFKTEIKNLRDNLKALSSVMKWFIGTWVVTLLGFFIYSIEKLIK